MKVINVAGDGNSLFRSISYSLYGNESQHSALRSKTVNFLKNSGTLFEGIINTCPDDGLSFSDHIEHMRTDGTWAGEDAVIALAEICKRDIIVHTAFVDPLPYHPRTLNGWSNIQIQLVFFEPGQYMPVVINGADKTGN